MRGGSVIRGCMGVRFKGRVTVVTVVTSWGPELMMERYCGRVMEVQLSHGKVRGRCARTVFPRFHGTCETGVFGNDMAACSEV